jgi:hypothetical protein
MMIELLFTIVVMGIVILSAPLFISLAHKSVNVTLDEERINTISIEMNKIIKNGHKTILPTTYHSLPNIQYTISYMQGSKNSTTYFIPFIHTTLKTKMKMIKITHTNNPLIKGEQNITLHAFVCHYENNISLEEKFK